MSRRRHNPALRHSELRQLAHAQESPYLEETVRVVAIFNEGEHYRLELGAGPTQQRYDWWPSTGKWAVCRTPGDVDPPQVMAGGLAALQLAHAIRFAPATTDDEAPCSIECAGAGGCDECLPPDDERAPDERLPDLKRRHKRKRRKPSVTRIRRSPIPQALHLPPVPGGSDAP